MLEQWVRQYSDGLLNWAYVKTRDLQTAEDLVQDTFVSAFHHLASFREDSKPTTWLFAILKNKIIDYYRKKVKKAAFNPSTLELEEGLDIFFEKNGRWKKEFWYGHWEHEQEQLLDDLGFVKVLHQCLDGLPETWRLVIELKYLKGDKGTDICQDLGISSSNYWQLLHRAKLKLRSCIESRWFKNNGK